MLASWQFEEIFSVLRYYIFSSCQLYNKVACLSLEPFFSLCKELRFNCTVMSFLFCLVPVMSRREHLFIIHVAFFSIPLQIWNHPDIFYCSLNMKNSDRNESPLVKITWCMLRKLIRNSPLISWLLQMRLRKKTFYSFHYCPIQFFFHKRTANFLHFHGGTSYMSVCKNMIFRCWSSYIFSGYIAIMFPN